MKLRSAILALVIGSCGLSPLSRAEAQSDLEVCLQAPQSECVLSIALAFAAQIKADNRDFTYGRVLGVMAQTGHSEQALALGQAAGFLNELQLQGNVAEGLARGGAIDAALSVVGAMETDLFRQSTLQVITAERIKAGELA